MDPIELLDTQPSIAQIEAIVNFSLIHQGGELDCPLYTSCLHEAIRDHPPPYGTEEYAAIYRSLSQEPRWMAVSLITNAEREGDGAKRLWSLAACSSRPDEKMLLKQHACDESRHAKIYLRLLDLSFPGAVSNEFRRDLQQLSPDYSMDKELLAVPGSPYAKEPAVDDYIQMNIAEIRTTIHHILLRRALALHCDENELPSLRKLLSSLLRDELNHVAYTARLIELRAREDMSPAKLAPLFLKRVRDFNTITTEELGGNVFDCSVACCARRPLCRAKVPAAPIDTLELRTQS